MRRQSDARVPDRAFVATITTHDGRTFTTTVYGRHATEAEARALADRPDAARVVVRYEMR